MTTTAKTNPPRKRAPRKTTPQAEQQRLWKRELRDLQATQRRAEREAAKQIRAHQRAIAKLEKELHTTGQRRADRIATLRGRLG